MIKDVIRKITSPAISCDAVQAVQVIQKEIEGINLKAFDAEDQTAKNAIDMFRALIKQRPRIYTMGSHCETLLAVLMTLKNILADSDLDDPDLIRICEVSSYIYYSKHSWIMRLQGLRNEFIAVSKLCCPMCWYALAALQDQSDKLLIRGYHATMSALVLPPILSLEAKSSAYPAWDTIINLLRCELRQSISGLAPDK